MFKYLCAAAIMGIFCAYSPAVTASPWGANYFPNVSLTTHDEKTVLFFDDLIKDKVVVINFIYTSCPDTCPLETAQLVKVQNLLGDRVGKDVFFYSITIDPDTDTPAILREYRQRFGARWTFLTGDNADIIELRRKLGLYIEEIQDGSNNHNVNMIIGNQSTGQWMKRSPFENTYVLADQIGNWLTNWKSVQPDKDYSTAPELRSIGEGEQIFRTRCASCHTITGHEEKGALGPDLLGVSERRDASWLLNWLRAPDQMLAKKDPIALAMYEKYNKLTMPNMRLNRQESESLINYIDEETRRLKGEPAQAGPMEPEAVPEGTGLETHSGDVVAIMNAWVRESDAMAKVNAGYMTLFNVGSEAVTLTGVESKDYQSVEVHEMKTVDGLMQMREITEMIIPASDHIQFAPGGMHLMLRQPKQHFTVGQTVEMTLIFKSGKRQALSVVVAAR